MSIAGLLLNSLFANVQQTSNTSNTNNASNTNNQSPFQTIQADFQQLGQDLQAGNLAQAQQDYVTLTQALPGAQQNGTGTLAQAFTALDNALQSGNPNQAQQAFSTLQQDIQQGPRAAHHFHHHHGGGEGGAQGNSISQAFNALGQALQSGNLSSAQQAFATLQQDLQPFGFGGTGSGSAAGVSASSNTGSTALDVTA